MHKQASELRAAAFAGEFDDLSDIAAEHPRSEGRLLFQLHVRRERDSKLRAEKVSEALRRSGSLICEVCAFDFVSHYGSLGEGFIECHHVIPLRHGVRESTLSDLALLCSNCHRMAHRLPADVGLDHLRRVVNQAGT